jgi:hypothetical protein
MNRRLIASAVAIAALACFGDAPAEGQFAKNAPGWLANLDQAKTQARQSGRPIFLVFR